MGDGDEQIKGNAILVHYHNKFTGDTTWDFPAQGGRVQTTVDIKTSPTDVIE